MCVSVYEVFLATVVCSIFTLLLYIISWWTHEENDEAKSKEFNTSNLQGLENDKPMQHGEPNEIIKFDSEINSLSSEQHSSGVTVCEKSDIWHAQDEYFRSRVDKNEKGIRETSGIEEETFEEKFYDDEEQPDSSVVNSDSEAGRLNLSIRYDNERSKLIVQILDGQNIIPTGLNNASEIYVIFSLIGPFIDEHHTEKYTRIFTEKSSAEWKEPMTFCTTFENIIKQHLYIHATYQFDSAERKDREISISLSKLDSQFGEMKEWFDLQYVQSSY